MPDGPGICRNVRYAWNISQLLLQGDQGLAGYLQCRGGLAQSVPRFVGTRDRRQAGLNQIVFDRWCTVFEDCAFKIGEHPRQRSLRGSFRLFLDLNRGEGFAIMPQRLDGFLFKIGLVAQWLFSPDRMLEPLDATLKQTKV